MAPCYNRLTYKKEGETWSMNQKLRTRLVSTLAVAALMCTSAAAASKVTTKMIEANYMGIRLVVDGVEVTPKDANGNKVEPFASSGTTYLPVRAIGEALGKEVTWDGSTATIYVGDIPGQADSWMKKLPPYQVSDQSQIFDGSDPKKHMSIKGKTVNEGVYLKLEWGKGESYAMWNTDLKYDSMTFTVGHVDGTQERDLTMDVYLDGEIADSYELPWDGQAQTFTIPLNRAANVKVLFRGIYISDEAECGMYDISFS